ncbi:MAG: hypothetical protein MUE40_13980 [Anaerolineae bacterium]|jgi:hypothetical protein|nr:hypothetical protein [Anaerolineae bacterium]
MAFAGSWYDQEHTVLLITVTGRPDWTEFHEMSDYMFAQMEAAPGRLDVITLIRGDRMPAGNPLPHFQRATRRMNERPRSGLVVIINEDTSSATFMRIMLNTVAKVARVFNPGAMPFVKSLPEALAIIHQDRQRQQQPLPVPLATPDPA